MKQLISVIIPTYNRADYLPLAINSVLNQRLPKNFRLEVIVVDDGSEDDTDTVMSRFSKKVTYKKIPHSGKPATPRNEALKIAQGDIIAFQDSDDLWAEDKLLHQLPVFEDKRIVMSFGNTETMDRDGKKSDKQTLKTEDLINAESFEGLLSQNTVSTLTVMIRSNILKKTGFFNETDGLRAVEDYELWLRIAASYPKGLKHVPDTLAYYRVHDQNISKTNDLTAVERLCTVQETLLDYAGLSTEHRSMTEAMLANMQENWSRLCNELSPKTRPKISVVMSVYNGEKHLKKAIEGIVESLALSLAPTISVNAIAPGPMIPPPGLSRREVEAVIQATPLKRWGGAEEIAKAVFFLLSSDFVTGETIRVDGGRHLL